MWQSIFVCKITSTRISWKIFVNSSRYHPKTKSHPNVTRERGTQENKETECRFFSAQSKTALPSSINVRLSLRNLLTPVRQKLQGKLVCAHVWHTHTHTHTYPSSPLWRSQFPRVSYCILNAFFRFIYLFTPVSNAKLGVMLVVTRQNFFLRYLRDPIIISQGCLSDAFKCVVYNLHELQQK